MSKKASLLLSELDKIEVDDNLIRAFDELAYTAYELGAIEMKLYGPGIIRLVKLAERFQSGVPDELRM